MLVDVMQKHGLSVGDVAKITGFSKSTISQIKSGKYNGDGQVLDEILHLLSRKGYTLEYTKIRVRRDVFVKTDNTARFDSLCDELGNSRTDLTSSFGVVIGRAGRGKTKAARRYAVTHTEAAYILYIDGFSLVDVAREIAFELGGMRPRCFRACLEIIEEATQSQRRLIIIDEADKMPKKAIEMLRGVNERCAVPIVLVGEESLRKILESERRLKSRVRQVVVFEPVGIVDVGTYYQAALGLSLTGEVMQALWRRAGGDFRLVVRDAFAVARIMNVNRLTAVTLDVVNAL